MLRTKVLVVDDSVFMRRLITRLIEEDPSLQVIGTAKNGAEAVKQVHELSPDVVTLDVEMPVLNGIAALQRIMNEKPTPILMLSSLTQDGARETIEALQHGAVDFITKPSGSLSLDLYKVKNELIVKIKMAAQTTASILRPPIGRNARLPSTKNSEAANTGVTSKVFEQIVAIGTSTGGPRALEAVLSALPAGIPYPILVVQHMPPKFTRSLAQRLDRMAKVSVVEAEHNQTVRSNTVYIAPGDYHMTLIKRNGNYLIQLDQESLTNGHRPSVDILFASVAQLVMLKRHYVIMTGMGSDGAAGMLLAKRTGAESTIAESKETCVVYGMPKSAFELGCVDHVVPLERIAAKIMEETAFQG